MKILLCARKNAFTHKAGDSVQILATAKFLKSRGLSVDINDGHVGNFSGYDLIHLFNLTRISETYEYFKRAEQFQKKIVLTPVYWNLEKYYAHSKSEAALRLWRAYRKARQEIVGGCSRLYPASRAEGELLQEEYGPGLPVTVVCNGIDPALWGEGPRGEKPKAKEKDYILCAARISPRKNQLALAKACSRLGLPLILAGEGKNKEYLESCLRYKNVSYEGPQNAYQLASLYRGAALHALCSFVETPGLASLEAAACGCNILSTREGSAGEYFGDLAAYCDPYDEKGMTGALEAGLAHGGQPRLKAHVRQNFSWEQCLAPLYQSYLEVASL